MTFIDLFAGIGGFRRGLELAGHKCVGFCEWDKYATASYTAMHLITEEQRMYVELSNGAIVYAVWYPKYECYVAIRKLTPRECFRLQGWTDDYFDKAELVNSDSQLYKQAGNGVTVNVVEVIGKRLREIEDGR